VIPATTAYARADDVEHALELLSDPDARAIAGGQSLVPVLKLRIARPALVVDLWDLPLRGIEIRADEVRIGALTTWDELASAPGFARPELAAIGECARRIGDLQVRNRGTIGGSLAHADPASDMAAVLIALDARVCLRSRGRERTLPVSELLAGPFLTVLDPGELVLEIAAPIPRSGSASAYAAVDHPASGFPLAGVAALVSASGKARIAVTGVADRPFLVEGNVHDALEKAGLFGDRFAPAEYRRQLAMVVAARALEVARARTKAARP
jgi:aerobic carbon-monoxide dehydrogenase medium subunit